jgi:hypothetical protein
LLHWLAGHGVKRRIGRGKGEKRKEREIKKENRKKDKIDYLTF